MSSAEQALDNLSSDEPRTAEDQYSHFEICEWLVFRNFLVCADSINPPGMLELVSFSDQKLHP
jgi:hypothetical protein